MSNGLEDAHARAAPRQPPTSWARLVRLLGITAPSRLGEAKRIGRKTVALTATRRRR